MVVVLLWSSNWVVMKSGLRVVGPVNFVMQRLLFSSIALFPFLVHLREKIPRDRDTWLKLVLLGITTAAGMLSTNIGLVYEKSGISAVLTYTQPLFVFCLAVLFLQESGGVKRLLGVIIGFSGVALLYLGRDLSFAAISYSVLFLLLGAFSWAVSTVYYKRLLSHVNPIVTNTVQSMFGIILLSVPAVAFEGLSFSMTGTYVFIIFYMSVCASAIAFTLWFFLINQEEATVVSASSFIVPMFALIFGWLFLQETVELKSALGFIFILAGLYLVHKG
jgi:drug/metabolite transporter (DMT)-like permease